MKKQEEKGKKTLGLDSPLSQRKLQEEEEEEDFPLYRQWLWVPQLKGPKWARTSFYGLRMDSTKKEESIVEISTFQKVYILRVSETSKMVSRFCVKRLFYPYQWQSRV